VRIELASFDDVIAMIKVTAPCPAGVVFFSPCTEWNASSRSADGNVSFRLSQRFSERTGLDAAAFSGYFMPSHLTASGDGK